MLITYYLIFLYTFYVICYLLLCFVSLDKYLISFHVQRGEMPTLFLKSSGANVKRTVANKVHVKFGHFRPRTVI